VGTNLSVSTLYGDIHGIIDIVGRMLPPDFNRLPMLVDPVWETVQISIWGTLLAIFLSIPLSLLAAKNTSPASFNNCLDFIGIFLAINKILLIG